MSSCCCNCSRLCSIAALTSLIATSAFEPEAARKVWKARTILSLTSICDCSLLSSINWLIVFNNVLASSTKIWQKYCSSVLSMFSTIGASAIISFTEWKIWSIWSTGSSWFRSVSLLREADTANVNGCWFELFSMSDCFEYWWDSSA